jgi:hypothetical protein
VAQLETKSIMPPTVASNKTTCTICLAHSLVQPVFFTYSSPQIVSTGFFVSALRFQPVAIISLQVANWHSHHEY